jgi:non-homologous end joining protein Ku
MPIKKVQSEFEKLSEILANGVVADECTAGELQKVHDQLQLAIMSGDPAQLIRDKKIAQQLVEFEETNPVVGKVVKDLMNALSSMGI